MGDCCDPESYRTTFSDRFARRMARRYRRRGLNSTQERLVGFLTERGIEGASVLEIGGGVGEIQVELLRRGASSGDQPGTWSVSSADGAPWEQPAAFPSRNAAE